MALALLLASAPAGAEPLVTGADTAKVLEIARGFGSAELETEADGTPSIRGRMNGLRYNIYFYGCDPDGTDCGSIQFWTFFDAPPNALAAVNAYNSAYRFGRAYVDKDGDVIVEMDVNLWGGVSPRNLDDSFDFWRLVLDKASEAFPEATPSPDTPTDGPGASTL